MVHLPFPLWNRREHKKNEDWFAMSESVYAGLRSVGFDSTYESGLRFLEWYCDRLRGRSAALP
jgi:hypothetical protein